MTSPVPPLTLLELADPGLPSHESYSPFCLKVHRALRLLDLPYTRRNESDPRRLRPFNPKGQAPVLLVGEEPVSDSTDIVARLQRLADRSLVPADPRLAAEARLVEELADTAINAYLVAARWADERNWPRTRAAYFVGMPRLVRAIVPNRLRAGVVERLVAREVWRGGPEECWRRFAALLDDLDARAPVEGGWVGGGPGESPYGLADVALFAQLHSLRTPLTPWQHDQVARRRRLTAWLDRVDAATRPATAASMAA